MSSIKFTKPLSRIGAVVGVCAVLGTAGWVLYPEEPKALLSRCVDFELKDIKEVKEKPKEEEKPQDKEKKGIATDLMLEYIKNPHRHFLINTDDCKYHHHICEEKEDYICTACYNCKYEGRSYLGILNLKCPETCLKSDDEKEDNCYRFCKPLLTAAELKENDIDLAYCEESFQSFH